MHCHEDVPVRISRAGMIVLRDISAKKRISQREYINRVVECVSVIAVRCERSGGDPLDLLETICGVERREPVVEGSG